VGFRRTGGFSALFLGLSFELPVFTHSSDAVRAADAEFLAVDAERAGTALRLEADVFGARAALSALDGAAQEFTARWVEDRDRAVRSAEARYEEGEGTLTELLDARRTRLAAVNDFAQLRAERRIARARVARLIGAPLDPSALCDDTLEAQP
jgi:outer membrane protein TolC